MEDFVIAEGAILIILIVSISINSILIKKIVKIRERIVLILGVKEALENDFHPTQQAIRIEEILKKQIEENFLDDASITEDVLLALSPGKRFPL